MTEYFIQAIVDFFLKYKVPIIAFFAFILIITNPNIDIMKARRRGEKYEELVTNAIKKFLGVEALRNVLFFKIPMDKYKKDKYDQSLKPLMDKETEADVIAVTKKGIFCFECKSFQDTAYPLVGSLNEAEWAKHKDTTEYSYYKLSNPFNQNYKHVKALAEYGYPGAYNIVCTNSDFKFTYCGNEKTSKDKPYFSMLRNQNERMALIKQGHGGKGFKHFAADIASLPDVYTDAQVRQIHDELKKLEATREERKIHAKVKADVDMYRRAGMM